jgi:hypothetical protein
MDLALVPAELKDEHIRVFCGSYDQACWEVACWWWLVSRPGLDPLGSVWVTRPG